MKKYLLFLCLLCSLSSCMSLVLQPSENNLPVSLSSHIYGYQTGQVQRHFSREIWTYHLFGLPQVPLGTREGLAANHLIMDVLQSELQEGQGMVRVRIRHSRTPLTWMATLFSLGILSPTAVHFEGDIVSIQKLNSEN